MARDTLFACCIAVFQSYEIADSQTTGYQAEDDEGTHCEFPCLSNIKENAAMPTPDSSIVMTAIQS